jgi:predicted lipoprotein with Yx(FWY)xxD motif
MSNKIIFTALAGLTLVLSACGTATSASTTAPAATDTSAPAATKTDASPTTQASPAVLNVSQNATLGQFLTDTAGMTLYIYTSDTPNTSTCYDGCATNWPPYLTNGTPAAGTNVTASMIGTTKRTDGTTQVTYNGWPLYYFASDKAAGDTNGEGKGGVWFVITPAGTQK